MENLPDRELGFTRELLSENGAVSTIRLMSLVSLTIGGIIGLYGVYRGTDLGGIAQVCSVFVMAAFGGKVIQKHIEGKNE